VANIYDLTYRVRLELGDQPQQFTFTATGDGSTKDYTLPCKPVDINTLSVYFNGNPIAYPTGYTLEAEVGVIHFVNTPPINASILITGNKFRYFTDDDICLFINTAIEQHTYNRTDSFGSVVNLAAIPPVEEYPLAILAVIEALWVLATDSAFDINITAPDGVVIPRAQRYQQLTNVIQQRWEQYRTLCAQLNIGLWRIEMGTLRRVSRTTNKLIPVYMPQEIDDARRPERVYLQNDLTGRRALPSYVAVQDLILYQGDSYSEEIDFPFDITGLSFKAQIRTYPNAPSLYATFTITTISTSDTLSKILISLTKKDTEYMPTRAFWDLQATDPTDTTYEATYLRGQVFTTQEVTLD
jgi:hypothetical protein